MDKRYTVAEVDALRGALAQKHFATFIPSRNSGHGWTLATPPEKIVANRAHLEEMVRTAMTAGHTAEDIENSYTRKGFGDGAFVVMDL